MLSTEIIDKLKDTGIDFACDVPMSKKTWIHRGPVVPLYVMPADADELEQTVRFLLASDLSFKVVGHTSNIYMLPSYAVDAIVSTAKMTTFELNDGRVDCDAGVNISRLAAHLVEEGYKGFEGFVGLPGTVGAAVINNASCYGSIAAAHLVFATILRLEDGQVMKEEVGGDFFEFTHRSSDIKAGRKQAILLRLTFRFFKAADADSLRKKAAWNKWHRETHQEGKAKNLGSIYAIRYPKRFGLLGISIWKLPCWPLLKIADRLFMRKYWYQARRSRMVLWLYGYEDLTPYVSEKNDNCFIWRDDQADKQFLRYQEFMHKSCELGKMEIEILK